ncbi:MAG: BamA/TamA family outer membrane protein [Polyangiaceae bacterium]
MAACAAWLAAGDAAAQPAPQPPQPAPGQPAPAPPPAQPLQPAPGQPPQPAPGQPPQPAPLSPRPPSPRRTSPRSPCRPRPGTSQARRCRPQDSHRPAPRNLPARPRGAGRQEARPRAPLPIGADKQERPSYDGREDEGASAGEVLLWVPRVALFPVYVVSEYVVRKPLGAATVWVEENDAIAFLEDLFTFGPTQNIGIVPTALLDFGFQTSVGVYFWYDDFITKGNQFRVHAATGGIDWLRLTVADRFPIDTRTHFKLRFEASRRPDFRFYGIGPESLKADGSTYQAQWLDFSAGLVSEIGEASAFEFYNSVRVTEFDATEADATDEEPVLAARVAEGRYPLPPGIEGYTSYKQGLRLALDSRPPRPQPGTGVRFDTGVEHAFELQRPGHRRWLRYGATLGGFVDIWQQRVISLSVSAAFADPLDDDEVPFTELVQLGGDQAMRGFRPGRLMGRSAAVATFEYRYPIWATLDGAFTVGCGNVFDEHLEGFDPERFRLSFTGGIRTAGERDHSFDILMGAGTETFAEGTELNSLRLVIGATRHF